MADQGEIEALERRVAGDASHDDFALLAEVYRRDGRLDEARRVAVAGLVGRPDHAAGRIALGLTLLDLGEMAAARYELERAMASVGGSGGGTLLERRDGGSTYAGGVTNVAGRSMRAEDLDARADLGAIESGSAALGEVQLAESELDAAFAEAESVREEMRDANQIAAQAIVAGRLDEPEGFPLEEIESLSQVELEPFQIDDAAVSPRFATATMARLLAEQGNAAAAERIRHRLGDRTGDLDAAFAPELGSESRIASGADSVSAGLAERARVIATLESWLANLQRGHA